MFFLFSMIGSSSDVHSFVRDLTSSIDPKERELFFVLRDANDRRYSVLARVYRNRDKQIFQVTSMPAQERFPHERMCDIADVLLEFYPKTALVCSRDLFKELEGESIIYHGDRTVIGREKGFCNAYLW
jgi:hypothetical protein